MQVADKCRQFLGKQVSNVRQRAFELHMYCPYMSDQIFTVPKLTAPMPRTDHLYIFRDSMKNLKMLFTGIERDRVAAYIPIPYNLTDELEQFFKFRSMVVQLNKPDSLYPCLHCCAF